jgi:pimeloyl-ACP methyl ester carboxylesterase
MARPTPPPRKRGPGRLATGLMAASVGAAGALALGNWLARVGVGAPEAALSGETGYYPWTQGSVRYTVKGRGEPLALIHGVYPGASSFEYRKVFDRLAERYRVFALDLLGFGQSGRPAIDYTPALYVELIEDFLRQVVGAADHPAHVIVSGMSAAFVIHAAARRPEYFSSLTLIEPQGQPGATRPTAWLASVGRRALLRSPLIGEALYNMATSRPGLRRTLGRTAYSGERQISDDILDQYYMMAHQPGGRFAPADALAGALDTAVGDAFASLSMPTLLIWGRNDRGAPVSRARAFQKLRSGLELRVFPTGGIPQEEAPDAFLREVTVWLRGLARV